MSAKPDKPSGFSEEAALATEFARDDFPFRSVLTPEFRAEIEAAARATLDEEREKISLRVRQSDLIKLKSRAAQEGIPYQTLINSLIHKYVTGAR